MSFANDFKKKLKKIYRKFQSSDSDNKAENNSVISEEKPIAPKSEQENNNRKEIVLPENNCVDTEMKKEGKDTLDKKEDDIAKEKMAINQELEEAKERYQDMNSDYVWAFMAGHNRDDFRGNPKYLFVYINRYRPDIKAYWLGKREETLEQVRSLGFVAHNLNTPAAQYAINHTGVLVAEQVKGVVPEGMENVKYLNLWHGVGFKHIERKQFYGDISLGLARKYVDRGTFYRDHQLMVVTSPTIEKEYIEDCGVDPDKFVRTGYLRCLYQQNFDPICSFNHDLRSIKGLPESTRMVVYAPTFRAKLGGTFAKAIEDIEALYQCCERNDLLLIFKVHPMMGNEEGFLRAWETYGDRPRFWFWDNQDDFYEIMDQMDMAIIDYSGIFSDMVAVGVKHYIRYIFDYEEYMQDGFTQGDYFDRTAGIVCHTFTELLDAIDTYQDRDESEEFQRINDKLWSYSSGKDDFEKTIRQVMDFKVEPREFPTLYSFDIFDTLISRKVFDPMGVFYDIREKLQAHGGFPAVLQQKYPEIRHACEWNVREFYSKTKLLRNSDHVEVSFDEIFARMSDVYGLSDEQVALLKQWELESEMDNVIPLTEQIQLVKELLSRGEKVVLISDMYLPKEFIIQMLGKADPVLADLPLFLSNEYGVLKTSQQLFFEVYKSFEPFYDFRKWIHYGDNLNADQTQPRRFKIQTRRIERPEFNVIQDSMVKYIATSDAYKVAAMQARLCQESFFEKDEFVISYVALSMVPYVDWALRDAIRRGYQTLYFISRDGHHLKRIADAMINVRGLALKTKYIYASRRTWRIPSFINEVDEGFWTDYGSFAGITSKQKLFKAMNLNEKTFKKLFPTIDPDEINFLDKGTFHSYVQIFKDSKEYNKYLLDIAAKERVLVSGYLKQEINFEEKFAIVEYYGRGYTQDSMVNLCEDIVGHEIDIPFYYSRSILPTIGHSIRYNFTTDPAKQYFLECIFANMPYKSIEEYERRGDRIEPVIHSIPYNRALFDSMERIFPEFASRFAALDLKNPEDTDQLLYSFVLDYYQNNLQDKKFAENIGTLVDSVALYGKKREYAPAYTMKNLRQFSRRKLPRGSGLITTSITMSYTRSSEKVRRKYDEMYQILPGDSPASGRLLSQKERESNQSFQEAYDKLMRMADKYQTAYAAASRKYSVCGNKILFVTKGKSVLKTSLAPIYKSLKQTEGLDISVVNMANTTRTIEQIAKLLAISKYVVVNSPVRHFCKISFREETSEIMIPSTPFSIYKKGMAVSYSLKWKDYYKKAAERNDISVLQIPSAELESEYRYYYTRRTNADCSLIGSCETDVYFDKSVWASARRKLCKIFPEAADKKVILYMPTIRKRKECSDWIQMMDIEVLQKLLSDEYVVVLNFNRSQYKDSYWNVMEIPGFSRMINSGLSVRKLMMAADVIVGDYRDTFYESALLGKPVYFTVGDYEEIIRGKNVAFVDEFEECVFGPVISTAQDLASQLQAVEEYDYAPMQQFCRRMFGGCNGESVSNVVEYLLNGVINGANRTK